MSNASCRYDLDTLFSAKQLRNIWCEQLQLYQKGQVSPNFNISLLTSFTSQPLFFYLGGFLIKAGINPQFHVFSNDQIIQTCLLHQKLIPQDSHINIILWRIEDLFLEELNKFVYRDVSFSFKNVTCKLSMFEEALNAIKSRKSYLVFCLPPFPCVPYFSLNDLHVRLQIKEFYLYVIQYLFNYLKKNPEIILADLEDMQRDCGLQNILDLRTQYLFKQPWKESFWVHIGQHFSNLIMMIMRQPVKCIALDCDGTLWGGTIGEDGVDGIQLSNNYPGNIYKDVQRYLLLLRKKGVLLALLSKNNEQEVWEVFDKHDEMVLRREHISAFSINWQQKHYGIRSIAKKINIDTSSICFIDDSNFEIEEMMNFCPEVRTFKVSENLLDYLEELKKLPFFNKLNITFEDQRRAKMIYEENQRQKLKTKLSPAEFLNSLQLEVKVQLAEKIHIDRIVQLLNKTNQFNLTTRRYLKNEVLQMFEDIRYRLFIMVANDIFGDYGLTGVAIVEISEAQFRLDSFLVSCRVLNRGVETAFLYGVFHHMIKEGAKTCLAEFISTKKNAPVKNFLSIHGFIKCTDNNMWMLKSLYSLNLPEHISLEMGFN